MIMKVYTVLDVKVEAYLQPFFARSQGEAVRMFADSVNTPSTHLARYPEDFILFEIGEYDDQSAGITGYDAPVHVVKAIDVLISDRPRPLDHLLSGQEEAEVRQQAEEDRDKINALGREARGEV